MTDQSALHNELAPKIMSMMVEPLRQGGGMTDVLVLLESVVVGTILAAAKLGGDEIVLDTMIDAVKMRLAEIRLEAIPPKGSA